MLQLTIDQNVDQIVNNEQRRSAVKFPEKLMNALDCGNYSDCIRWTVDGLAFEILEPAVLEAKLLKEVFNGTKLHSFIRKIYKWGFVTLPSVKRSPPWKIFCHVAFRKGQLRLCRQMKRDKKIEEYSELCGSIKPMEMQAYSMTHTPTTQRTSLSTLTNYSSRALHHECNRSLEYPSHTTIMQSDDFDEQDAKELLRALQDEEF